MATAHATADYTLRAIADALRHGELGGKSEVNAMLQDLTPLFSTPRVVLDINIVLSALVLRMAARLRCVKPGRPGAASRMCQRPRRASLSAYSGIPNSSLAWTSSGN